MTEVIDYRECTKCGPPGSVGLTFVAMVKGFDPEKCDRCGEKTLMLKVCPKEVLDDMEKRGEVSVLPDEAAVARARAMITQVDDKDLPTWYADHVRNKGGINANGFASILSKPESVQKIMLTFPPACVVRVKSTGKIGINKGIIAGDTEFPTILVANDPKAKHGVEHALGDLEVLDYWNGLDPLVVRSILDVKTQQAIVRREPKIDRNGPCPCGSGKKAKRCTHLGGGTQKGSMQ